MSTAFNVLDSELIAAIEQGDTLLAPTLRASYQLKLAYAQYAVAQGRRVWRTPIITSFDDWAERLWRTHAQGSEVRVLSVRQAQLVWDRVVRESKWFDAMLNPLAAARLSFRSWQRMIAWQLDRDDLLAHISLTDNSESAALVAWHDAFVTLCTAKRWLPTTLLPQKLLAIAVLTKENIASVGTQELRPIELALLRHAENAGATWKQLASGDIANPTRVVVADSMADEFFCAARWADEQITCGKTAVGIVVPELETHAPQIERTFSELFAPANRTLGFAAPPLSFSIAVHRPLAQFPIVRAALDILNLSAGRAASTLAGIILRNPYIGESEAEAGVRSIADLHLRSQTREHYDLASLAHVAATAQCTALVKRLHAAQDSLRALPIRNLPSRMAETFVMLWQAFGWPGEQPLTSDEQQIVSRLYESLGEFGALDELLGNLNLANAVREFEQLAMAIRFAPRILPTPITIVDASAIDGLQFDALWATGMEATRWPPPAAPDPFIPIELQLRAEMPFASAMHIRTVAARRFTQLRSIAPQVTMSWPRRDADIELSPSPWLQGFETIESFAAGAPTYGDSLFAAAPMQEVIKETAAPPLRTTRVKGGARIFELQSLCPFRAQAELRLRAQPLEEVLPSIDARERGTLIHAALADIWRELRDWDGLRARNGDQMEALVRTALSRHVNPLLAGATSYRVRMLQIEMELAAQRILELLTIDIARRPFRVIGHPETPERKRIGALDIELRLDRMDEAIASEQHAALRVVIDYKTGSHIEASSWYARRPTQPQLPLYAVTHADDLGAVAFATLSAKSTGYFGVAKEAGLLPGIREFDGKKLPPPHMQWQGLLRYWREVIEKLANDYAQGVATIDPTPTACRYCHLASLCRIDELANAHLHAKFAAEHAM